VWNTYARPACDCPPAVSFTAPTPACPTPLEPPRRPTNQKSRPLEHGPDGVPRIPATDCHENLLKTPKD
jgi:hypothetical protein